MSTCIVCGITTVVGSGVRCVPCQSYSNEVSKHSAGVKHDAGKTKWHLLELPFLESMARILTYGAKKYEVENWKSVEGAEDRYYDALMRHLVLARRGEVLDSETGESHLAAVAVNAMFLWWFQKGKSGHSEE